jgi:predicted metal-dependent TIM-barrel fold hydrolase
MKMVEPHVHMDGLNRANLEEMALAGITTIIADAGPLPAASAQGVFDFYERTFTWDAPRVTEFLMEAYVTIGINMLCIPPDWEKVIEAMPNYLKREKVVGIGEIGVDPRSFTCPDIGKQEEVLRAQLKVVSDNNVPVRLHMPPTDKSKWLDLHFKRIEEFKLDKERVIITHADASTLKTIIEYGCIGEVTMQPWRKLGPEEAAYMLKDVPLDRVMIDSDSAIRVSSDPLSVPKAVLQMRKQGFKEEDIEKVVCLNPKRIFNLA